MKQLSSNLYVTIVGTGVFNAVNSLPLNGSDNQFLLSIEIQGNNEKC